jgi:CheY-like chemotaxis protein
MEKRMSWPWEFSEDHFVRLIQISAWPVIAVALMFLFGKPIKRILGEANALTLKGGGFEVSASRESIAAAAALGAAVHHKRVAGDLPKGKGVSEDLPDFTPLIERTSSPRSRNKLHQSNVLWVDDNPNNNLYERQALEALGIRIDLANDTQEALRKLGRKEYELVISDMARPSSKQAGCDLLKKVRERKNSVPFIVYSGFELPQPQSAQGSTNDPRKLFELALNQLLR